MKRMLLIFGVAGSLMFAACGDNRDNEYEENDQTGAYNTELDGTTTEGYDETTGRYGTTGDDINETTGTETDTYGTGSGTTGSITG